MFRVIDLKAVPEQFFFRMIGVIATHYHGVIIIKKGILIANPDPEALNHQSFNFNPGFRKHTLT